MSDVKLTLFIAGQTTRSQRAVSNLRQVCDNAGCPYELTIVDILEHPEVAEAEKILAIPTLVKEFPLPGRRIIGDLSNHDRLLKELDIKTA